MLLLLLSFKIHIEIGKPCGTVETVELNLNSSSSTTHIAVLMNGSSICTQAFATQSKEVPCSHYN